MSSVLKSFLVKDILDSNRLLQLASFAVDAIANICGYVFFIMMLEGLEKMLKTENARTRTMYVLNSISFIGVVVCVVYNKKSKL